MVTLGWFSRPYGTRILLLAQMQAVNDLPKLNRRYATKEAR
jgi:hypothetical protein